MNKELQRAKARWHKARLAKTAAQIDLNNTIHQAAADGMSQAEIGRVLGWPRQRVNTVLGRDS